MDENQQPSVTQELGRLFPNIRGGWRRGESTERWCWGIICFLGLVLGNHLLQQLIQIQQWGSKATSKKLKSMSHKTASEKAPSKFAILSFVKPCYGRFVTWFMPFLKFNFPRL